MTTKPRSNLEAVVTGRPVEVAPVVTALWSALAATLRLAPRKWRNAHDLADDAAALIGCRPSLADELIATAADLGHLERHATPRGDHMVRLTPTTERNTQ